MTHEQRAALLALAKRLRNRGSVEVRRLVSKGSDNYDMLPRGTATEGADAIEHLLAALAVAEDRAEKFMWQVRDTCVRAEKAEAERDAARAEAARLKEVLSSGPVAKADLAEAFGCVWNAALGVSIEQQEDIAVASMLAESFHAMAQSLKTPIK